MQKAAVPVLAIHDTTAFPIVSLPASAIQAGYASNWIADMEQLTAFATPFVVILPQPGLEQDHEDQKSRGLWIKANRGRLGSVCRGFVTVEPDAERRQTRQKQAQGLQDAIGITMIVVAGPDEAKAAAARLLG